jgi:hypothetical protein
VEKLLRVRYYGYFSGYYVKSTNGIKEDLHILGSIAIWKKIKGLPIRVILGRLSLNLSMPNAKSASLAIFIAN